MTFNTAAIARANNGYQRREPGWYVVNHNTDLAVAGPFQSRFGAESDRHERNARFPNAPEDDLVIVEHENHGHA